jgi:hypothetical protein
MDDGDSRDRGGHEPNDPNAILDALRSLSMRAAADFLSFVHKVKEAGDGIDGTTLSGGEGSSVSARPRPGAGEFAYEAIRLHLAIASQILTLGERHADLWLDRALRFGAVAAPGKAKPAIRLVSKVSDQRSPSWKLFIYNAGREARTVHLVTHGGWSKGGTSTSIDCPPQFRSGDGTIPPRTDQEVDLTLGKGWEAKLAEPGTYVLFVEVQLRDRGIGRLELVLTKEPG